MESKSSSNRHLSRTEDEKLAVEHILSLSPNAKDWGNNGYGQPVVHIDGPRNKSVAIIIEDGAKSGDSFNVRVRNASRWDNVPAIFTRDALMILGREYEPCSSINTTLENVELLLLLLGTGYLANSYFGMTEFQEEVIATGQLIFINNDLVKVKAINHVGGNIFVDTEPANDEPVLVKMR